MPIFVSYSRADEETVEAFVRGLQAANREVWYNQGLDGGNVWWDEILENIRLADAVLFMLSRASVQSEPCQAELDYAMALNRPIIPVQVGEVGNLRGNPLSTLQIVSFQPDSAVSAFKIIAAIDEASRRLNPLPDPLPAAPTIPFAYLLKLGQQIEREELTQADQRAAVDQLGRALGEESDPTIAREILNMLVSVKKKPWCMRQTATQVDAILLAHAPSSDEIAGGVDPSIADPMRSDSMHSIPTFRTADARAPFSQPLGEFARRRAERDLAKVPPQVPTTPGVFISYRRQVDSGLAGRLYDRLANHFGADQVFMDVDTLHLGVDFGEVIVQNVAASEVLLAVIGPGWLGASDSEESRRLDDPDDFVRIEIAAALDQKLTVIPILVHGAVMPRAHELPSVLAKLARRNALNLRHENFRSDADRLIGAIERVLTDRARSQS